MGLHWHFLKIYFLSTINILKIFIFMYLAGSGLSCSWQICCCRSGLSSSPVDWQPGFSGNALCSMWSWFRAHTFSLQGTWGGLCPDGFIHILVGGWGSPLSCTLPHQQPSSTCSHVICQPFSIVWSKSQGRAETRLWGRRLHVWMRGPAKKVRLFYPTPGHLSAESHDLKGCMNPDVYCSTIYNRQSMETA